MAPGSRRRRALPLLLLGLWLAGGQVRADSGQPDPRSRIQRPAGHGVAYLVAAAAVGKLNDGLDLQAGHSVSLICRPHRAADFLPSLYARNTALVLQVDKQGADETSILSADIVLRRYLGDMRAPTAGRAVFAGLGAGISHAAWSARGQAAGGSSDAFSFLAEAGLEWNLDTALVLLVRGQYRLYDRDGHDHSGWSAHLGLGLPSPF